MVVVSTLFTRLEGLFCKGSDRFVRLAFFCCVLFSASGLYAQQYRYSDPGFGDKHHYRAAPGERVLKTWYHYVVSRVGLKYVLRTFYPETGALTGYYTYSDQGLKILDGPFEMYSDDGMASTKGTYVQNQLHGPWKMEALGHVLMEGHYAQGLKDGEWVERFADGRLKSRFTYVGDEELGPYVMYDTLGVMLDTGNSILGERYTQLPPSEFEARRGRRIIDQFPCFGECDPNLSLEERTTQSGLAVSEYIRTHARYPEEVKAWHVSGRVNASIRIDRQGKVAEVKIVNGLCEPIAGEARRVLSTMPAWQPGTKQGQATDVWVLVPFDFAAQ